MTPFLSFYDNAIYKNLICPQGIAYNLYPGSGGFVILKYIISRTFNYVEQNGYLKILIGRFWENGERERGASRYPITFNY